MDTQNLGPLTTILAYAANLGGAAVALRLIFFGRAVFDPNVEMSRVLTRAAGVLIMVGLAIAFVTTRQSANILLLSLAAIVFGGALLVFLLRDLGLRTRLTVTCPGDPKKAKGTISGYELTDWAKRMLAGDEKTLSQSRVPSLTIAPTSAEDLFCKAGKKSGEVWTKDSISKAHQDVSLAFIVWIAAACLAISCSAILIEKAVALA
jgi:hypothetical protein